MSCRSRFATLGGAAALAVLLALPAAGQSLKPDEVLSSIVVRPLSAPDPVRGADGRVHLAYELAVSNASAWYVRLDRLESVDASGNLLATLSGEGLTAMTHFYAGRDGAIAPGGSAVVFLDVSLDAGATLPAQVSARTTATRLKEENGTLVPDASDGPAPAVYTFTGAPVVPGPPAVVVAPPLRGKGWVAVSGCCDALTAHRGAILAINGRQVAPERFAIDWVKLQEDGHLFTGHGTRLADYAYYGDPILAAADGVVVNRYDEADEQVPGPDAKPTGIVPANIGGNMLVVDIGGGAYAFYAHLQRGSLKVGLGDRVKTGDVIGLLGNTGNSTAPHLHFHVMDGPSPLNASGLPYVFTRFSGQGTLSPGNEDELENGKKARIEPRLVGAMTDALPLNNQVVDFE
ncbi:M23 family metallopeptidase [Ancylobacter sp. G4_0304]|uniref:M23 family metallopeptidase n=1 Tax=Ancylobacter sp. G4_0304 TaxID=3114289 RepID=UPI0039C67164